MELLLVQTQGLEEHPEGYDFRLLAPIQKSTAERKELAAVSECHHNQNTIKKWITYVQGSYLQTHQLQ